MRTDEMGMACSMLAWDRIKVHTEFQQKNLKE
jgi:hypothetical protein